MYQDNLCIDFQHSWRISGLWELVWRILQKSSATCRPLNEEWSSLLEKVIAFDGEQGSFRRTVQGVMREEGDTGLVCRISLGDGQRDIYNRVIVICCWRIYLKRYTADSHIFDDSRIVDQEWWTQRTKARPVLGEIFTPSSCMGQIRVKERFLTMTLYMNSSWSSGHFLTLEQHW